jgi:hypothetical protein
VIENKFRVALLKEGGTYKGNPYEVWVAVCLERFIVGQGETKEEALEGLESVMWWQAYLDTKDRRVPFAGIDPAPAEYNDKALEIVDFSVDYDKDFG